jgi:putative endonuclease
MPGTHEWVTRGEELATDLHRIASRARLGTQAAASRHRATLTCNRLRPSVTAVSSAPASAKDRRRWLGRRGEQLAAQHLERLGYVILARNYRTRCGELDLVACDARTLVFCEVKTRQSGAGSPWQALGVSKQAQVRRIALVWLAEVADRPYRDQLRFDAIGVWLDGAGRLAALEHLEAAF